ncbi:MAG: DUF4959 domain-containing protein [Pigmentiphaga sp.]|nr:DUF4959 domain-containing protein [Pigmentiphaga sp.]
MKLRNMQLIRFTFLRNPFVFMFGLYFMLMGCEDTKRYAISSDDTTPPGIPIFIDSKPLPGGARVFFRFPKDEDVLYVEASYTNSSDQIVRSIASYFTDSLDIVGFDRSGEHIIKLCAVDRAGNRSEEINETVTALDPPLQHVANSMQILSSFNAILLKWNNTFTEPIYVEVNLKYLQNGAMLQKKTIFSSLLLNDIQSIEDLVNIDEDKISLDVFVKDKFGNSIPALDTTIVLLSDLVLNKDLWTLPAPGFKMAEVLQTDGNYFGGNMSDLIDGITEENNPNNFFYTKSINPWSVIVDLGEECELSRIVTHQRYSGEQSFSTQGNYYRGNNVLAYNMYIWDAEINAWEFVSRNDIQTPVVKQETDYKIIGDNGDEAFLYPEEPRFSKPTRFFRFEAIKGSYISEITLYGKKL